MRWRTAASGSIFFRLLSQSPLANPAAWRVLVYDGIKGGHRDVKPRGQEPLRYIDVWTGERDQKLEDHPTAKEVMRIATI